MNNSIAAIILTKNEAKHIVRCIESLQDVCDEVIVVDSLSTDNTCELAERMGARVYKNPWKNYATQFNYGVYECDIQSEWIWRIDADEFLEGNLGDSMKRTLAQCGCKWCLCAQTYRLHGASVITWRMVSIISLKGVS